MHLINIHRAKNTTVQRVLVILTGKSPNDKRWRRNRKILMLLCSTASQQGFDVYITTPNKIRVRRDGTCQISAWDMREQNVSQHRTWITVHRPLWIDLVLIPDIHRLGNQYRKFVQTISQADGYCLNGILPSKDKVFQELSKYSLKQACIPTTQEVLNVFDVFRVMEKSCTIWLKPVRGSGGRGVVQIKKKHENLYQAYFCGRHSGKGSFKGSRRAFERMIKELLKKKRYISQVHVPARKTSENRIVDIRVTLCKGENGTWGVVGTTLRKSSRHSIVTNYHAGGETCSTESPELDSLLLEAGISQNDITRAHHAALDIANALEKSFPSISTLGIDISPTKRCCYVYDCNSRPGRDILTDSEIQRMIHRWVQFALYTERIRRLNKSETRK